MPRAVLGAVLGLFLASTPAWAADSGLALDPSLVQSAAKSDGITNPANPDQFAKSLTSTNNFLDFCKGAKLTNGAQVTEGSCNPTPMGFLPSVANMPSVRIIQPSAETAIPANADFDVVIASRKIKFGFFTSPSNTYYLAPQQLSTKGLIKGHTHIVIQEVVGKGAFQTDKVAFFKGIADKLQNGRLKTTVKGGLPDGHYRISTLTSAMNHQLVALPVAKRGAVDDAIYVRVGSGGSSGSGSGVAGSNSLKSVDDGAGGQQQQKKSKKHNNRKVCRLKKRKA